jgi:hypothetical protein
MAKPNRSDLRIANALQGMMLLQAWQTELLCDALAGLPRLKRVASRPRRGPMRRSHNTLT